MSHALRNGKPCYRPDGHTGRCWSVESAEKAKLRKLRPSAPIAGDSLKRLDAINRRVSARPKPKRKIIGSAPKKDGAAPRVAPNGTGPAVGGSLREAIEVIVDERVEQRLAELLTS